MSWPHAHAVRTRLRHLAKTLPSVREVARHEAGHVVAYWSMGVRLVSATARPGGGVLGETVQDESEPWSDEEALVGALAGRVEDERRGRHDPMEFLRDKDEYIAMASAVRLGSDDPGRMTRILVRGEMDARGLLDQRQAQVEAVAGEMAARDLDEGDLVRLLGPLPPPAFDRPHRARGVMEPCRRSGVWACIATMLGERPRGLALVPGELIDSEGSHVAWIDPEQRLVAASFDCVMTGVGEVSIVGPIVEATS